MPSDEEIRMDDRHLALPKKMRSSASSRFFTSEFRSA